jgi:antitoxin component YwqK of YwqJK toxin-antitoxin module
MKAKLMRLVTIMLVGLLTSVGPATAAITIVEVEFDDDELEARGTTFVRDIERGEEFTVKVYLVSDEDVEDVQVETEVRGYDHNDRDEDFTDVFDMDANREYVKELELRFPQRIDKDGYGLTVAVIYRNGLESIETYDLGVDSVRHDLGIWDVTFSPEGSVQAGRALLTSVRVPNYGDEDEVKSGYKLIELDTSKSQPSALIQKGDQQAWIGLRLGMPVAVIREVASENLTVRGGLFYVKGDKEPFNGMVMDYHEDGSKCIEWPFVNGKRHGMHIWYGDDGQISTEAPYVNGKEHGMKIRYYKDGSKSSETLYVDGNANGTGIKYRQDGSKERETVYVNVKHKKQSEVWYREDGSKWKEMRYDMGQHYGIPTYYDENGIKKEEPPMVDGKLHGMVMDYHEDGLKAMETPYVDGKKHGMQITYRGDGSKDEEIPYVEGKRHGTKVEYRRGYKWRETPYVNGKEHGMQIMYHGDGSKERETVYVKRKKQSEVWYFKDGSTFMEIPFVDGHRHGMVIQCREDGSKWMETPWVDGKITGMRITYYEDGSKFSETPYVDGNANGTGIKYRRDGSKESETVCENHKWQSEIWYRENGSKWKEMRYDIDPMIMMKSHPNEGIPTYYDENGIKKEEAPMVDGKLHGMVVLDYHENGSKSVGTPYVDGKKHGTSTWYYEDGSKRGVVPYVDGKKHGTSTWYHKNGSKSLEVLYENGKKISRKEF